MPTVQGMRRVLPATVWIGARKLGGMRKALLAVVAVLVVCPAAAPAREPDLSSPKAAAREFFRALAVGSRDGAKAAAIVTADEVRIIDAMVVVNLSRKRLADAAVERFGEEGKLFVVVDRKLQQVEAAEPRVLGDRAVMPFDGEVTMVVRLVGRVWKVDLVELNQRENLYAVVPTLRAMAATGEAIADEVVAGKHATAADARKAFAVRVRAAVEAVLPTSRPATTAATTRPAGS